MQPQATPRKNSFKAPFVLGVLAGAFAVGLLFSFAAKAFNGPGSNSAGSGNGSIGVDSANNISIGTGTPISGTKALIVGSTTDSSAYALQVLNSNGASGPILYIRNDGSISVATTTVTAGTFTIQGALTVSGVLTAGSLSMQVSAGNVTSGLFNGSQSSSSGNFAFPAYLGVGTSTQVSLPSPLSVYGDGYFSGVLSTDNIKTNTGQSSTFVGVSLGQYSAAALSASDTTAVGAAALNSITSGWANTGIGAWALARDTTGYSNVAVGYNASLSQTGGIQNAAIGDHVLFANVNGSFNVAIGFDTLAAGKSSNSNTAVGYEAGFTASSTSGNVFLGFQSGYSDLTGSNDVFLGYEAGYFETSSNKLYIANASTGAPLIYGDFSTGQVAINTTTLNGALSIAGALNVNGNATTTGLTVTNLGSSGSPCLTVGATGVVATTTCSTGGLSGGQANFIPIWTGASSLGTSTLQANGTTTYTLNGFAIGTSTLQAVGNLTITKTLSIGSGLAVSGLGSTGTPCVTVSTIGVFATTTCDSLTGTGQANFIPLWSGAGTFSTSSLQANGTTTYTLNGFAVGTSTSQGAGNISITGSYLGGTISAGLVSSNVFGSGNFAFPSSLGVGTSSTAVPSTLSVYGSTLITATTTLTGVFDASGAGKLFVPVAANPNVSASGSIAYSTTNNLLVAGDGNVTGTVPRVLYSAVLSPATDLINSSNASGSEKAFTTSFTFPANYFIANKMVHINVGLNYITSTTTPQTMIFRLELRKAGSATTTLWQNTAVAINNAVAGTNFGLGTTFFMGAITAPSASASMTAASIFGGNSTNNPLTRNTITQPVAVDTTAAEVLQLAITYANNTFSASTSIIFFDVEETN